jgi:tetratricopeptide (TPR) repeat protein
MNAPTQANLHDLIAAAAGNYQAGRLAEAEAGYRAALAIALGRGAITSLGAIRNNLGVVLAAQSRHRSAVDYFDEAIAGDPVYLSAHYNRAVALMGLGETHEAIKGFSRVCAIEPGHYASHRALGFLWLGQGNRGRALDHFARTYELRRGEDRAAMALSSLTTATRQKLAHDGEQFRYLSQRLRDGQRFEILARAYEQVAQEFSEDAVPLSDRQFDILGENYNTAIHIRSAPELAAPVVNPRPDRDALVSRFNHDGVIYFDDLLTPAALLGLRRYLLESTIWHDFSHIGGFVASYLEDGLACPLLLQIADDIRRALPELLGDLPLSQAWVFKGLQQSSAIDAHADDAAISVNFWITPDEANLDPAHGGMVVCRVPPPPEWEIKDYDTDQSRAVTFLGQNAAESVVVCYRQNRAVVFKSRLLHYSDTPKFSQAYENHRINMTMLFGGAAASGAAEPFTSTAF